MMVLVPRRRASWVNVDDSRTLDAVLHAPQTRDLRVARASLPVAESFEVNKTFPVVLIMHL